MDGNKGDPSDPPPGTSGGTGHNTNVRGDGTREPLPPTEESPAEGTTGISLDMLRSAFRLVGGGDASAPPLTDEDGVSIRSQPQFELLVGELMSNIGEMDRRRAAAREGMSSSREGGVTRDDAGTDPPAASSAAGVPDPRTAVSSLGLAGIPLTVPEVKRELRLVHQSGNPRKFKHLLEHYFPIKEDQKKVYKEITGDDKRVDIIHRPPAGGHGSLFNPQNEESRLFNPSSHFALERAIQSGFANTRTGAPVGDLRYLAKQKEEDANVDVPLNPEDGGTSYTFTMMRKIFDPTRDASFEERMADVQNAFSESVCENMIKAAAAADSEQYESNHNTAITIPCPVLRDNHDKNGDVDGGTLKTLEAIYHRKNFSGQNDTDIRAEDFFRKMYNFLNHRYNTNAAYLIMQVACVGAASDHVYRCEGMNLGFVYMWDSMTKMYMTATDPDVAEKALIDLRSKRPRNVAKYLRYLWQLCREAAYSKPPEMRPSAEINRFRDEADRMVKRFYPFVHKAITQRDKKMSIPWQKERDRLVAQNRCPDTYATVHYHPLASYIITIIDEVGDLSAANPKKEQEERSDKKGKKKGKSASVAKVSLENPYDISKSAAGAPQNVADAVQRYLDETASDDGTVSSETGSESDIESEDAEGTDFDLLDVEELRAKPHDFKHLPTGAKPKREDGKERKGKSRDANESRVCILCSSPFHSYPYCPTYPDMTPVGTRCTQNPRCLLFHSGPCKYDEALKAIAERAAKKKEREAAKQKPN